jgi:hypothetical protein
VDLIPLRNSPIVIAEAGNPRHQIRKAPSIRAAPQSKGSQLQPWTVESTG